MLEMASPSLSLAAMAADDPVEASSLTLETAVLTLFLTFEDKVDNGESESNMEDEPVPLGVVSELIGKASLQFETKGSKTNGLVDEVEVVL